jgi:hypothetical protein
MAQLLETVSALSWRLQPAGGSVKRDFLSLHDLSMMEFAEILDLADELKHRPESFRGALAGRSLAIIFEKPSLRTRVTFEVGMVQLGGHPIYLAPGGHRSRQARGGERRGAEPGALGGRGDHSHLLAAHSRRNGRGINDPRHQRAD